MAHFAHSHESQSTDGEHIERNARYGLILFAIYTSLYGVFMILNAFAPKAMETIVFAGINLAVVYGISLITSAFVFALVYAWLCRRPAGPEART